MRLITAVKTLPMRRIRKSICFHVSIYGLLMRIPRDIGGDMSVDDFLEGGFENYLEGSESESVRGLLK